MTKQQKKETESLAGSSPNSETKPPDKSNIDEASGLSKDDLKAVSQAAQAQKPEEKPKKTRKTRKSKKAEYEIPDFAGFGSVAQMVCGMVAKRCGDHWNLDEEEKKSVGQCLDALEKKYAEDLLKYQLELYTALILFTTFYPRVEETRELQKAKKASKSD